MPGGLTADIRPTLACLARMAGLSLRRRPVGPTCGAALKGPPMIILAAILLGALLGDLRARRARGNTRDRIQYALAHALALSIPAIFVTILIDRMLRG